MNLIKYVSTPSLQTTLLFLLVTTLPGVYAHADELVVPVGRQGAEKSAMERPKTAMTTSAVEARFGAPLQKIAPVGNPPISSWEYPDYIVYFESDRVIHSVLKPFRDETAPTVQQLPATTTETPAETPVSTPEPTPPVEAAPAATTESTEATETPK